MPQRLLSLYPLLILSEELSPSDCESCAGDEEGNHPSEPWYSLVDYYYIIIHFN